MSIFDETMTLLEEKRRAYLATHDCNVHLELAECDEMIKKDKMYMHGVRKYNHV